MIEKFTNTAMIFVAAAAVFCGGLLCASMLKNFPYSDWWSPISAVATSAAVIVALLVGFRQERGRDQDRRWQANVIASAWAPKLEALSSDLHAFFVNSYKSESTPEVQASFFLG